MNPDTWLLDELESASRDLELVPAWARPTLTLILTSERRHR